MTRARKREKPERNEFPLAKGKRKAREGKKVGRGGRESEKGRKIKVILISRRKSWFDQLAHRAGPVLDHIREKGLETPKLLA